MVSVLKKVIARGLFDDVALAFLKTLHQCIFYNSIYSTFDTIFFSRNYIKKILFLK